MMPEPTWTSHVMGHVTADAARETGLASGTPVITGTADAAAEAVAAGLSGPGDMMVMYGSSTFFILRTEGLRCAARVLGVTVPGGGDLRRCRRDLDGGEPDPMVQGQLLRMPSLRLSGREEPTHTRRCHGLADASPAGSRGVVVLPYFSGERTPLNDPDARGVIFGLTLGHTRADIYRAVLESVGFSIRHNIEALRAEGCRASRILAVGGGTRNPAWMQIVSDIAGIEQVVPARQIGASYGDAFLAGIGVGLFSGTAEAQRWVRPGETIRPNEKNWAVYDAGYALYRDLYEQTKDSMKKAGRIAQM